MEKSVAIIERKKGRKEEGRKEGRKGTQVKERFKFLYPIKGTTEGMSEILERRYPSTYYFLLMLVEKYVSKR